VLAVAEAGVRTRGGLGGVDVGVVVGMDGEPDG